MNAVDRAPVVLPSEAETTSEVTCVSRVVFCEADVEGVREAIESGGAVDGSCLERRSLGGVEVSAIVKIDMTRQRNAGKLSMIAVQLLDTAVNLSLADNWNEEEADS